MLQKLLKSSGSDRLCSPSQVFLLQEDKTQELCILLCVQHLAKTPPLVSPGELKRILKLAQLHPTETDDAGAGQQHL